MRERSRELVETRAGVRPLGRAARLIDRRVVEPALLRLQRTYGNRFVQRLVRATDAGDMPADLERQIDQTRATGGPLESSVRAGMEAAFG